MHEQYWELFNKICYADANFCALFSEVSARDRAYHDLFWQGKDVQIVLRRYISENKLVAEIYIRNNSHLFEKAKAQRDAIEREYGNTLIFAEGRSHNGVKAAVRKIYDEQEFDDISDVSQWKTQIEWMKCTSLKLKHICDKYL